MPVVVVFSTFPNVERAADVVRTLVDERLAACANLVPGLRSIYRWNGQMHDDSEVLAIVKTTDEHVDAMIARLRALHPYETPEAIALPVTTGSAPYLAWVAAQTGG